MLRAGDRAGDQRRERTALADRRGDVVVAVDALAGEARRTARRGSTSRESNSTLPVTRVAGSASAEGPADDRGDLGQGQLDHAIPPVGAPSARRATSRSSNGWTDAGDLLAGLVALAGDQHGVARPGRPRWPRRSPRPGRRSRRPRPAAPPARPARRSSMARRIAAGSSERGLSSVTISRSASRAATSPMSGRLPRSRSPPQPSTMISRPRGERAQRPQRAVDRRRLVAVVDDARNGWPASMRSMRPGTAARATAGAASRRSTPTVSSTASASSAFATL